MRQFIVASHAHFASGIVEADDTKVKYVNDLLGQAELDEF